MPLPNFFPIWWIWLNLTILQAVQRGGEKLRGRKVELVLASETSVWHEYTPSSRYDNLQFFASSITKNEKKISDKLFVPFYQETPTIWGLERPETWWWFTKISLNNRWGCCGLVRYIGFKYVGIEWFVWLWSPVLLMFEKLDLHWLGVTWDMLRVGLSHYWAIAGWLLDWTK